MSAKNSTSKTLIVALALCVVCSIIVSTAAVALKEKQVANKLADKTSSILAAAGMGNTGKSDEEVFKERVIVRLVNIETGEYLEPGNATEEWQKQALANPVAYDQRKASKTDAQNIELSGDVDQADIKRMAKYATVYLAKNEQGEVDKIILPVKGYGLWSTLYGFLALEKNTSTVVGLGFYEHAETPGLGGEVDNPAWKALWHGKEVLDEDGNVDISIVKGSVDPSAPGSEHKVDALAGATLTSKGVENLVQFWLGKHGFGPYLAKVRKEGV